MIFGGWIALLPVPVSISMFSNKWLWFRWEGCEDWMFERSFFEAIPELLPRSPREILALAPLEYFSGKSLGARSLFLCLDTSGDIGPLTTYFFVLTFRLKLGSARRESNFLRSDSIS